MRTKTWISSCLMSLLALTGTAVFAQGHGHGHHKDKDDGNSARFDDDDRDVIRNWYDEREHAEGLPPGLAKRDQLAERLDASGRLFGLPL